MFSQKEVEIECCPGRCSTDAQKHMYALTSVLVLLRDRDVFLLVIMWGIPQKETPNITEGVGEESATNIPKVTGKKFQQKQFHNRKFPLVDEESSTIFKAAFYILSCVFGNPRSLIVDEAVTLDSHFMRAMHKAFGIKAYTISVQHHESLHTERYINTRGAHSSDRSSAALVMGAAPLIISCGHWAAPHSEMLCTLGTRALQILWEHHFHWNWLRALGFDWQRS